MSQEVDTGVEAPEVETTESGEAPVVDRYAAAQAAVRATLEAEASTAPGVYQEASDDGEEDAPDPAEQETVEAAPANAEEAEPTVKPQDDAVKRAFESDKALREARAEAKRLAEELENVKKLLALDPAEALKAAGITDPVGTAEDLYHAALGDNAPAEYKLKVQERKLQIEREKLQRELQAIEAAKADQELVQYQAGLRAKLGAIDPDTFPAAHRWVQAKGTDAVYEELWSAALSAAQAGTVLTADQLVSALEEHYAPLVSAVEGTGAKAATQKAKPAAKQTKSLRNTMQRSKAPTKPIDEMSPEEYRAYRYERAQAVVRDTLTQGSE